MHQMRFGLKWTQGTPFSATPGIRLVSLWRLIGAGVPARLFVYQKLAEVRVFVRPDPSLKERQLVPQDGGHFVG